MFLISKKTIVLVMPGTSLWAVGKWGRPVEPDLQRRLLSSPERYGPDPDSQSESQMFCWSDESSSLV